MVKILLAQALFGDPEIILLDEPTNHHGYTGYRLAGGFSAGLQAVSSSSSLTTVIF